MRVKTRSAYCHGPPSPCQVIANKHSFTFQEQRRSLSILIKNREKIFCFIEINILKQTWFLKLFFLQISTRGTQSQRERKRKNWLLLFSLIQSVRATWEKNDNGNAKFAPYLSLHGHFPHKGWRASYLTDSYLFL